MNEVWKPVTGYEGLYEVSNLGRVKSLARLVRGRSNGFKPLPERIKLASTSREGYASQHLYIGGVMRKYYVHRLVAKHFIANPFSLPQVNHIDGNKLNNAAHNLEWCSGSENCSHAIREHLYKQACGESTPASKITERDVLEIRRLWACGVMQKDIAAQFPIGRKAITKIVNYQRWKHVA